MECKKCGKENPEESQFCSKCGNNLKNYKKMKEETKSKIEYWIIIILNYLGVYIVGLIAFIYYLKKDKNKSMNYLIHTVISALLWWFIENILRIDYTVIFTLLFSILPILLSIASYVFFIIYINKLGNKINQPKGLLYISAFIPIIGLVLYCAYVKKEEELGVNCGKLALIGITLPFICLFLMFIPAVLKVSIQSNTLLK